MKINENLCQALVDPCNNNFNYSKDSLLRFKIVRLVLAFFTFIFTLGIVTSLANKQLSSKTPTFTIIDPNSLEGIEIQRLFNIHAERKNRRTLSPLKSCLKNTLRSIEQSEKKKKNVNFNLKKNNNKEYEIRSYQYQTWKNIRQPFFGIFGKLQNVPLSKKKTTMHPTGKRHSPETAESAKIERLYTTTESAMKRITNQRAMNETLLSIDAKINRLHNITLDK